MAVHSRAPQNDGQRLVWKGKGNGGQDNTRTPPVEPQGSCSDFFIDELDIRSFAIQFQ